MKKTLIMGAILAGAIGAFAQGTVTWSDGSASYTTHIYGPQASGVQVTGNAANDIPAGTTVYDAGSVLGGAATGTGLGNGNNISVQLYGLAGTGDSLSSLQALSQYTGHIATKAGGAGEFVGNAVGAGDPGIPGSTAAGGATVALAAWFNGGGTYSTLALAQSGNQAWGFSAPANIAGNGGQGSPPATPPFIGVQSFSLTATSSPEPSTIALGVMGASAFLLRRRMSK